MDFRHGSDEQRKLFVKYPMLVVEFGFVVGT